MQTTEDNRVIGLNDFSVRLGRELVILACISVVGLAIRLPYFFPAVIDWDESTFIIIGQSTVDGFLPNEIAWDLKPAFVFWWFGAAIKLFGKTIPAVRVAGLMWLVLSAYLLYRAAFSMTDSRLGGVFAAAMLIVASSAYSLNVSTEHLAVLPMAGAILVLCYRRRPLWSVFLGGIVLGLACMFRMNLIYLTFVVGVVLCIQTCRTSWEGFLHGALKKGAWFSFGIVTPIVLGFLPYLISGQSQLWVSVYKAAVSYSEEQRSFVNNVVNTLHRTSTDFVGTTMWGAAILGAVIIFRRWRNLSPERRSNWLLCGAFVLGSVLSIVMTGPVYGHYFIQLVPGLAIFAAAAFVQGGTAFLSKADWAKFVFGSVLIAVTIFRTTAKEWNTLTQRVWTDQPLSYGIEYDIADFIRSQWTEDFSLFMMDNHLVYWLLGSYPPTRLATHPSALGKPFVRKYLEPYSNTTEDALRSVFRREPTFVVWRPNLWYLDLAAVRFLEQELTTAYVLLASIGSAQIYRRTARAGVGVPP